VVKANLCGISTGTELMLYRGNYPNFKHKKWPAWEGYPIYPGYELVGCVVEVGPEIKTGSQDSGVDSLGPVSGVLMARNSEFAVGDRVICLGEHAEYAKVPATLAAKLPDNVSDTEATLAPLGCTTMHATRQAEPKYGDTAAVIGMGTVGLLVLQHLLLAGVRRVVALDLRADRLEAARTYGAELTINPRTCDAPKELLRSYGVGADFVIETSGAPDSVTLAIDLLRDRGTVVLVGWHVDGINFLYGDLYFKEAKLVASRAIGPDPGIPYAYVRWGSDQNLRFMVDLLAKGKIRGQHMQPSIFSWKELPNVYALLDRSAPDIPYRAAINWT
jgi:2-desacetyl-2-hydroxyethyl bacteriochlorophyllide A dehydrogenase